MKKKMLSELLRNKKTEEIADFPSPDCNVF